MKKNKGQKFKGLQFDCLDLDGKGRTLRCRYYGHEAYLHLQLGAMIKGGDGSPLEIGISLHQDNIVRHEFKRESSSLDLWYSRDPIRKYMVCPNAFYTVPEDMTVNSLNVYDM